MSYRERSATRSAWMTPGRCALGFDGGIETLLAADEDGDFLSISTELNVVADEAACRAALALNYGHLPPTLSIALDPASGRLILFGRLPVTGVTSENLVEALAELVTLCPLVCAQLTASGSGEPAFHPELMIRG